MKNEKSINLHESVIEMIAEIDKNVNGPIPDDPWEAYIRGVEAGLITELAGIMTALAE